MRSGGPNRASEGDVHGIVGSKTGEIASGQVSIAAACMELEEGTAIDPGGTWLSAAVQLAGNYQMVEPRTFS